MKKVSRITELLIKAHDRAYKLGDAELVKMLEEANELHNNLDNKVWEIHEAMETIKRYR